MTYSVSYWAGIVILALLAMSGVIQVASPEDLGLSPIMARWLGVVTAGLAIVGQFLPPPQRPPVRSDNPSGSTRDPMPRDE